MGKQAVERRSIVLQASSIAVDAEAHGCRMRTYLQVVENPREIGISSFVVNDKTSVYVQDSIVFRHIDRIDMPAELGIRLEQRYLMISRKQASANQTGNS